MSKNSPYRFIPQDLAFKVAHEGLEGSSGKYVESETHQKAVIITTSNGTGPAKSKEQSAQSVPSGARKSSRLAKKQQNHSLPVQSSKNPASNKGTDVAGKKDTTCNNFPSPRRSSRPKKAPELLSPAVDPPRSPQSGSKRKLPKSSPPRSAKRPDKRRSGGDAKKKGPAKKKPTGGSTKKKRNFKQARGRPTKNQSHIDDEKDEDYVGTCPNVIPRDD